MELTSLITTLRHGEKSNTGDLTENGIIQARRRGVQMESLKGDVLLFDSGSKRVKDTVESASSYLGYETKEELTQFIKSSHLQHYTSRLLHYLHNPEITGEYYSKWDKIEDNEDARIQRMNNFLKFGTKSPDEGIAFSPLKLAQNVTKLIVTQIDFSLVSEPTYRTNFINGSHEPVISAFIHFFLNDLDIDKTISSEWQGKSLDYTEGFEIKVYESFESYGMTFTFRDFNKEIDLSELRKFIRIKI